MGNSIIPEYLEACEGYARNFEVVRYITDFVMPELVVSRLNCTLLFE